jgi:antitoxin component YwqK of YwqJK toxin-antitoxin module
MLVLWMVTTPAAAQQAKNATDAQGRKQGYWEAVDRNGKLVYAGYFKDNRPTGEMKRFHPDGSVRVIMQYDETGEKAYARFLWQNGEIAAEGNYLRNKRDSIWTFYNDVTHRISNKTGYREGMKHGISQSFYPFGNVAEEVHWENDRKEGAWQQFFEKGGLKLSATYRDNKLEGSFVIYFPDGKKETEGIYRNNLPEGTWTRYNADGTIMSALEYKNGVIADFEKLTESQQDFFNRMEAEKGKIPEPDLDNLFMDSRRR